MRRLPHSDVMARMGYRVLLVDRAPFPSDTISTHCIQPLGVAALRRWGLLDRVTATGCPAIIAFGFDFGPIGLGRVPHPGGSDVGGDGLAFAEFAKNKTDVEGNYLKTLHLDPDFADRIDSATRQERIVGTAVPGYFRKPYGPGWALVGDAGYNKDFITAQGIADAFRDAELGATALNEALTESRPFDDAMGDYQASRDAEVLPMYEFTAQVASLEPPSPRLQQLLGAIEGNQNAMDAFARVNTGVTSPAEFFSDENVGRILAGVR